MQVYGLEGRYATALYSAATKQKKLEQVEKELLRVWVSSPAAAIYLGRGVPLPGGGGGTAGPSCARGATPLKHP